MSPTADNRQAVLMFHGVGTPPAGVPAAEIPYWIDDAAFSAIVAAMRARSGGPEVVWTFDDGNASDLGAAETLAAAGFAGKFYVLSGRVGQSGYLSASDLRALDAMGMEVGLHGRDHVDWRHADAATFRAETVDARKALADIVGKPVATLAIPFGAYNRRVIRALAHSDFARIYTSDTGPAHKGDRFVRRNPVMAYHRADDVVAIVEDRVPLARRVRRTLTPFLKRHFR